MLGLSTLGLVHTVISLVALFYGAKTLIQEHQITSASRGGRIYLIATLLTALTALGIFRHGTFGPPHVLALMTLAALAFGAVAGMTSLFGRFSRYAQALGYTATVLFHLVPGVTETMTRLPPAAPIFASPEAEGLKAVLGAVAVLFFVGLAWQLRWLRSTAPR